MILVEKIRTAQERLKGKILETPLSLSRSCTKALGAQVHLKFENQQLTGSFKIRGALNKLLNLPPKDLKKGLVAASAGNHAQGVALASSMVGAKAHIVMPVHSSLIKREATQSYGAEVILHGESYDESYQMARRLEKEHSYTFVHPFEDEDIIAGQGTLGVEILEQLPDISSIVISVGGGGLIAGVGAWIKAHKPDCKVYGVVSDSFSGMKNLFYGKSAETPSGASTIADGIAVRNPSDLMFKNYIQPMVDDIVSVEDGAIAEAMVFLMERTKTVVEGSGAITWAGLCKMKNKWDLGQNTCALLCGGNVDLNLVSKIIEHGLAHSGRIARFTAVVPDRPGMLLKLTSIVADHQANILQVQHDRLKKGLRLRETAIEFLLETRNLDHTKSIIEAVRSTGAHVQEGE